MTATAKSWVLITGASSGFGEQFARQYSTQGHSLVLVAHRLDRLLAPAEALRQQYGIEVVVKQVELLNHAAIFQLHQQLLEQGIAIDILINTPDYGLRDPFVDDSQVTSLMMLKLYLWSLTGFIRVFAQDMRARGCGKIQLVASLPGYPGLENPAVYEAARTYLLRLGETLRHEFNGDGITVTSFCPDSNTHEAEES